MLKRKFGYLFAFVMAGFLLANVSYSQANPNYLAFVKWVKKGNVLSGKQVKHLEDEIKKDPNDLEKRSQLLVYYETKSLRDKSLRKPHGEHVLWMIENHPESKIFEMGYGHLAFALDGEVYEKAKALWVNQVDKNQKNIEILGNAGRFFWFTDAKLSEKYYQRCIALDPQNPTWHEDLALAMNFERPTSKNEKRNLKKGSLEELEKAIHLTKGKAPDSGLLCNAASDAYETGEIKKAKNYAEKLLSDLGKDNDAAVTRGYFIQMGNSILGKIALESGDFKKAGEYLIASGKATKYGGLKYSGPETDLAEKLLEKGEKDVVLQYLRECAKFWKNDQGLLKKWIVLVKKGEKPDFSEKYYTSSELKKLRAANNKKWSEIKEGISWVTYSEAEKGLKEGTKPVLYDFSAEWCGPCKRLKKEVFGNKKNASWINRSFIPVLALDRKQEEGKNPPELDKLQNKYKITGFPTLVMQFPDGKFRSSVGYGGANEVRKFLEDGLAEFQKVGK